MFKKALIVLIGMVAGLVGIGTVPAVAGDAESSYMTKECVRYDGSRETCWRVGWRRQSDGSGVRVEQFYLTTADGCWIIAPGVTYADIRGWLVNPSTNNTIYTWDLGTIGTCDKVWDVEREGLENGNSQVDFKVRQGCNIIEWSVVLQPDGEKNWRYSRHAETGSCGGD